MVSVRVSLAVPVSTPLTRRAAHTTGQFSGQQRTLTLCVLEEDVDQLSVRVLGLIVPVSLQVVLVSPHGRLRGRDRRLGVSAERGQRLDGLDLVKCGFGVPFVYLGCRQLTPQVLRPARHLREQRHQRAVGQFCGIRR